MYTTFKTLVSSVDFDNAMFFLTHVSVWRDGRLISDGGYVDGHNADTIVVNGEFFERHLHEFRAYTKRTPEAEGEVR